MGRIEVAAAVILRGDGRFLLAQRPAGKVYAGYWEFPGGKVEHGESAADALARELHEELGIEVLKEDLEPFWFLSHDYHKEFGFHMMMPVYLCRVWKGEPKALEHDSILWEYPRDMHQLDMIEADAELIERLSEYMKT